LILGQQQPQQLQQKQQQLGRGLLLRLLLPRLLLLWRTVQLAQQTPGTGGLCLWWHGCVRLALLSAGKWYCTRNMQQGMVTGTAAVLAQRGLQLSAAVHMHCMAFLSADSADFL
jgi:hypothetical protein